MAQAKSKSETIRELAAKGLSRGDIARKLDVRYQFVRNVLVADEAKKAKLVDAVDETRQSPSKVRIGPDGSLVLPTAFREALGLKEGDPVILRLTDGELRLYSVEEGLRRAQEIVRSFVPKGTNLVDELLEDRRREAQRDLQNG